MLFLKTPQNMDEAISQRNYMAKLLLNILNNNGMIEDEEYINGQELAHRANLMANMQCRAIALAENSDDDDYGVFMRHRYNVNEVFPCLITSYNKDGSMAGSGYGWCPVDFKINSSHRHLAGFNSGVIPGIGTVDESLSLSILNLDSDVYFGGGYCYHLNAASENRNGYIAEIIKDTPCI